MLLIFCLLLNFLQTCSVTDPPVQALDLLCNPFMHRRKSLRAVMLLSVLHHHQANHHGLKCTTTESAVTK